MEEAVKMADWPLSHPELLANGPVFMIVATAAEAGRLANDERITVIACDQLPQDFMATALVT